MSAFLSWIKTIFGYFAGRSAGVSEQRTQEIKQDADTSQAVAKAAVNAPATPGAVSDRLRGGTF